MLSVERSEVTQQNAQAIAGVINRAFAVEVGFVDGDRTSAPEVLQLLCKPSSAFFVAVEDGDIIGCVYTDQLTVERGYLGLLAVERGREGGGLGLTLMARAEEHLRSLGCDRVDITVVDLRTELFPFYDRRGYRRTGQTLPFPRQAKQPCQLVTMTKSLREA